MLDILQTFFFLIYLLLIIIFLFFIDFINRHKTSPLVISLSLLFYFDPTYFIPSKSKGKKKLTNAIKNQKIFLTHHLKTCIYFDLIQLLIIFQSLDEHLIGKEKRKTNDKIVIFIDVNRPLNLI